MNKVELRFLDLGKLIARKWFLLSQGSFLKKFQMSSDCVTNVIAISKIRKCSARCSVPLARKQRWYLLVVAIQATHSFFLAGGTELRAEHFRKFKIAINFITQSLDIWNFFRKLPWLNRNKFLAISFLNSRKHNSTLFIEWIRCDFLKKSFKNWLYGLEILFKLYKHLNTRRIY